MKKKQPVFKLTEDERKLESEIERGEWNATPRKEADQLRAEMLEAARNRIKDARVNLRLNPHDVERLRKKAEDEGIPYQTLIGSVLHKYVTNQLLDGKAVRAVLRQMGRKAAS